MMPLGDGDAQPKTMEVLKKQTPMGITEMKKIILTIPVKKKKPSTAKERQKKPGRGNGSKMQFKRSNSSKKQRNERKNRRQNWIRHMLRQWPHWQH